MDPVLQNTLNTVVSNATPLVIAALGETITERAGVINLSLDGSLYDLSGLVQDLQELLSCRVDVADDHTRDRDFLRRIASDVVAL